jgi:hypothetical protein
VHWLFRLLITATCGCLAVFVCSVPSNPPIPWWGYPPLVALLLVPVFGLWWPYVALTEDELEIRNFAAARRVPLIDITAIAITRNGLVVTLDDHNGVLAFALQKGLGAKLLRVTTRPDRARLVILDAVQRARTRANLPPASDDPYGNKHHRPERRS